MHSISLTSEDASSIVLALIADKHPGQALIELPALQGQWGELGLRADDLLQALTLLAREQQLSIKGEAEQAQLILVDSLREDLPPMGEGMQRLSPALQELLAMTAERISHKDDSDKDEERRDGFS